MDIIWPMPGMAPFGMEIEAQLLPECAPALMAKFAGPKVNQLSVPDSKSGLATRFWAGDAQDVSIKTLIMIRNCFFTGSRVSDATLAKGIDFGPRASWRHSAKGGPVVNEQGGVMALRQLAAGGARIVGRPGKGAMLKC